ncbi:MAG: glycosyltransferase [Caldilineaceae bacterium]|nr:glycosyltransferase [Caldilineaceae bacterium]MBP8125076.1 glycosyltransferase [Caldilineaceae bacterium]MBP9072329.1 glycosyltransferase [Caldilineaceae bacterium]
MRVLYHVTTPPPALPGTEAVLQEIQHLLGRVEGEVVYLNPSPTPRTRVPRPFYGLHRLPAIRRREAAIDLHHIFNPDLFVFPVLRFLRKPVIYSVVSGLGGRVPRGLGGLSRVLVPSRGDVARLAERGYGGGRAILPGIDLAGFTPAAPPPISPFVILAGSAPWTAEQFRTKGVDALLAVAVSMPDLQLIFLWRGVGEAEMRARVAALGLDERVEIIGHRVDVNTVLARSHAAILLADRPEIVKAYPHSLLETLAVGRPVLISDCVPMSEYVQSQGCGEVVAGVDEASLAQAIGRLRAEYGARQSAAVAVGRRDFDHVRMVDEVVRVYGEVIRHRT